MKVLELKMASGMQKKVQITNQVIMHIFNEVQKIKLYAKHPLIRGYFHINNENKTGKNPRH